METLKLSIRRCKYLGTGLLIAMVLILMVLFVSCKSTETVITRDHVLSDTLIRHETELITLPTHYTTIIKNPCLQDSLKALDHTINTGNATVTIKNQDGNLAIEVDTDSIINSRVEEIRKRLEKETSVKETTVVKTRVSKWFFYLLGYSILLTLYTFRKFIPYLNLIP